MMVRMCFPAHPEIMLDLFQKSAAMKIYSGSKVRMHGVGDNSMVIPDKHLACL